MKKKVIEVLAKYLHEYLADQEIEKILERPAEESLGDFALPCFVLAKRLRKSPPIIAQELAVKMSEEVIFAKAEAVSGYLNLFLDRKWFSQAVLEHAAREEYGTGRTDRRTVVEFCSPNTNKPLHLGHLRNIAIGESLSRVRSFLGEKVAKTCVYNDRGIHICKSMLAYRLFGQNAEPAGQGAKSDHFTGDFYVLFAQKVKEDPSLEEQAQQMLLQWEAGEAEVTALWRKMNAWTLHGFTQTFKLFGTAFDREYYESEIYKQGKEIILEGLKRGIFSRKPDGAVIADLSAEGLDEKVLLRSNGTSVYMVQDIYLAFLKARDFSYDQSIYVVGNEQEYHFRALKAILQKLGEETGHGILHLSYGMVELPEGKMKSREGTSVDADDLIRDTALLAEEEIRKRYDLSETETKERALKIALAAIKYQLLKTDTTKNMLFNPKEAIRFEGDTGPYILYSYARASSILRKTDQSAVFDAWEADVYETRLLKKIDQFPEIAQITGERPSPSLLAVYAFELAQVFNEFYHECPVLKSEVAGYRLALVTVFRSVIGKCLDLMGIEKIEEM